LTVAEEPLPVTEAPSVADHSQVAPVRSASAGAVAVTVVLPSEGIVLSFAFTVNVPSAASAEGITLTSSARTKSREKALEKVFFMSLHLFQVFKWWWESMLLF